MAGTAVRHPPTVAADGELPGSAELLSDAGAARVARFLDGRGLDPHRVEPAQAHYRPGRWLTVCYRTGAVERSSGRPVTPTVTVECRAGEPEAIWAFPDDPVLTGLRAAADGHLVRRRLRPRPGNVIVEPLRYRPRRRAVLRYRLDGGADLFGKVLTPKRARRLLTLAEMLHPGSIRFALPAGRLGGGGLVVPRLPGTSLRDLLLHGRPLPSPDRLAALSTELPRQFRPGAAFGWRASVRRRVDPGTALCAAHLVARLLPDQACAAARLAEAIIACADESDPPEERLVHGDLYENQILVDGDTLGLLDLDDLGLGDPLLDAANFSAHLLILGASGLPASAGILRYREEVVAAYLKRLDADPAAIAWREAYCLLRLTSGPFRVLRPDWPERVAGRLTLAGRALRR